jgi:hypothetical protein
MSSYEISVKVMINKKREAKTVQVPATGSNKKQKVTQIIDSDSDEDYLPEMPQQVPPKDKEEASFESNSEQEEQEQDDEEYVPDMQQQVPEMQEHVPNMQRAEMLEVEEKEDIPVLPDRFTHRGPSVDYQGRTYHWHPARVIPAQYYKPKAKVVKRTGVARNNK